MQYDPQDTAYGKPSMLAKLDEEVWRSAREVQGHLIVFEMESAYTIERSGKTLSMGCRQTRRWAQ